MTPVQTISRNSLECPKCGKHTVVEMSRHLYQCISCDFYRELPEDPAKDKKSKEKDNGKSGLLLALITGLLILIVL